MALKIQPKCARTVEALARLISLLIGSKHTIVIGGVPRLGIPENLEGYTLRSRISFKPSSPMMMAIIVAPPAECKTTQTRGILQYKERQHHRNISKQIKVHTAHLTVHKQLLFCLVVQLLD